MFRINSQDASIDFPYKGININAENDMTYAKFIQNILISDNKTGSLRYGTDLVCSFNKEDNIDNILEIMSFLTENGTSKKLVYATYMYNIDDIGAIEVDEDVKDGWSKITITLTQENKNYLNKSIIDGLKILISGNNPLYAEIQNVQKTETTIEFIFPIDINDIEEEYSLFIERAGIYLANDENSSYSLLKDDLDPLVIVSYINFQGKLLIANGVDPVQVYDGYNITELYGPIGIANINQITLTNTELKFKVPEVAVILMQQDIKEGDELIIRRDAIEDEEIIIASITYGDILNEESEVTIITTTQPEQLPISKLIYEKLCPSFSHISVVYKRLFALGPGRTYKDKFKSNEFAMKIYYAAKEESIYEWFNQKINDIEFINLSDSSRIPDNLEAITTFCGKTLFFGREEVQIWGGQDPTTRDDGQNISLPDFQWEQTLPIGLVHQKLFLHLPNQIVFLSKYGIVALGISNITGSGFVKFDINYQFSNPIDNYINYQLSFIESDRDFRNIKCFLYPYAKFFGFKIQYSCFIYQINLDGAWVVFSENFAESSSIFYDVTTQNLYLGMPKGNLLTYTDKIKNRSFMEYGKGDMQWLINYNWNFLQTIWNNKYIYIFTKAMKPLDINIRIYLDNNETKSIISKVQVNQNNVLYDTAQFSTRIYPSNDTTKSYELISFRTDSFMIELKGSSNDLFIFNKMFLVGGING